MGFPTYMETPAGIYLWIAMEIHGIAMNLHNTLVMIFHSYNHDKAIW